jgi:hypothetical protein
MSLSLTFPRAAAADSARPALTLSVATDAPASLFNLVDRLSAWRMDGEATDARYRAIWDVAAGPLTPQDEAALRRWRAIRRRYQGAPVGAVGGADGLVAAHVGTGLPFPVSLERLRLEDRFAVLFLGARGWDDLARRAEVLLPSVDRDELSAVVDHFRGRLGPALRRSLHLDAYAARIHSWEGRRRPAPFFERLGRFLHASAARPLDFELHLVWLPADEGETRATVVDRHAALEVREGLGLRGVLDVAVHELVHRLEERLRPDVRGRLERAFLTAPEAQADGTFAVAAAHLFHEGLATAVGQGLFAEELFPEDWSRERPWYEDPSHDRFAKLISGEVKAYLDTGRPIDEALVHRVVRLYAASFDSGAPGPGDLLRRCVVLADDPQARAAAVRAIFGATRPRIVLDYPLAEALAGPDTPAGRALATFPALPVVILSSDGALPRLSGLPAALRIDPAALRDGAVTTVRRPRAGPVYVARAVDESGAAAAFARFLRESR